MKYHFVSFLLLVTILNSCKDELNLRIEKSISDQNVFYGKVNSSKDSLMELLSMDMEKSFSLPPINLSSSEKEIRIYYSGVWYERFYIEKQSSDSIEFRVYNCRSSRKNDSLFMNIKETIKATGKQHSQHLRNTDRLPVFKNCQLEDNIDYLDKGYFYFIEVKSGPSNKKILIDDNCLQLSNDKEIVNISKFIKSIDKSLNVSFGKSWQSLDSLAFKTNN